jgi:serine/threonine protein kinase
MKTHSLDEIERLLDKALMPQDLFDVIPLNELLFSTHPDRNPGDSRAEILFKRISEFALAKDKPAPTIKSPKKRTYSLVKMIEAGDVADIYRATAGSKDYIVKISRVPDTHSMLENERKALTALITDAGDLTYHKYLPVLVESFPVKQRNIQQRVNVFTWQEGFHTAAKIHQQHEALGGRHLAWIFKRLLTALGFVHKRGWVHGAVLPEHCLIQVENHGLQLVGWGQSVEVNHRIHRISSRYKEWYPSEVLEKKLVGSETDIYMAAKLMIYLAGGDPVKEIFPDITPEPIKRFIRSCLLPGRLMRPGDAWLLFEELDNLLKAIYGPPRFIKLVMA